jgi:hypothetical protein
MAATICFAASLMASVEVFNRTDLNCGNGAFVRRPWEGLTRAAVAR